MEGGLEHASSYLARVFQESKDQHDPYDLLEGTIKSEKTLFSSFRFI